MATGRTTNRWVRVIIGDTANVLRDIPVDSIGDVGLPSDETDVTAWQDAIKNIVIGLASGKLKIGGPFDNSAAQACTGSGLAPTLSGSHTVLQPLDRDGLPHTLEIDFGIRGYWTTGDPVFGLQRASAAGSGYTVTGYTVNGEKYSCDLNVMGGIAPTWGSSRLTAGS